MTSPNDSVIICDSPGPSTSTELMNNTLTNYRKRLRSDFKCLLDTVYKSPLVHLRRNFASSIAKNTDGDISIVSSPPRKKIKSDGKSKANKKNLDRSIVIINDTKPKKIVEIALSDAETNEDVEKNNDTELSKSKRKAKMKKSVCSPKFRKTLNNASSTNGKNKKLNGKAIVKGTIRTKKSKKVVNRVRKSLRANDENHNGQNKKKSACESSEVDDIEVLWVSKSNSELQSETTDNERESFFIDTNPMLLNKNLSPVHRKKKSKCWEEERNQMESKTDNKQQISNVNVDSNPISTQNETTQNSKKLREIIIDGSNVAMGHMHGGGFSEKGLQIVIDYFKDRGHTVKAFLPQTARARNRELLEKLHKSGLLVFTPSRRIGGKKITSYDDRYIIEYATQCNGIVVSTDQFRDLWKEKPQWRNTIENRLLVPTFVGDYLMFPEDPLGRTGPRLDEFLRH